MLEHEKQIYLYIASVQQNKNFSSVVPSAEIKTSSWKY